MESGWVWHGKHYILGIDHRFYMHRFDIVVGGLDDDLVSGIVKKQNQDIIA